jgi:hypothetical protein
VGAITTSGNISLASQLTFNSDTALRRSSAGVLEINNGTPGTLRDLSLRNFTAAGFSTVAQTGASGTSIAASGLVTTTFNTALITQGQRWVGTDGTTYWTVGSVLQSGNALVQLDAVMAGTNQGRLNLGGGYLYVEGGPTRTGIRSFGPLSLEPAALGGSGGVNVAGQLAWAPTQSSLNPTISDLPNGRRASWYNTTLGEFRDWVNIGGTLYKSRSYSTSNETILSAATYQATETTGVPTGTTHTVVLNNNNHQSLNLESSTGDVTITLNVPSGSCAGTLIIKQHASTSRDITWITSAGSIKWLGAEPTWSGDAVSSYRIVSWRYNGSIMFMMSTESGI